MSKRENKISGNRGERAAEQYLRKNGYRILARNFMTDTGELDLVATDDAYLVFVEVKSRMSDDFGAPSEAVDFAKQRKLSMVASQYIEKKYAVRRARPLRRHRSQIGHGENRTHPKRF